MIFAKGVKPCFLTASSEAKISIEAPSFRVEALAAVTVPSFLNTGLSVGILSNFTFENSSSCSQ